MSKEIQRFLFRGPSPSGQYALSRISVKVPIIPFSLASKLQRRTQQRCHKLECLALKMEVQEELGGGWRRREAGKGNNLLRIQGWICILLTLETGGQRLPQDSLLNSLLLRLNKRHKNKPPRTCRAMAVFPQKTEGPCPCTSNTPFSKTTCYLDQHWTLQHTLSVSTPALPAMSPSPKLFKHVLFVVSFNP